MSYPPHPHLDLDPRPILLPSPEQLLGLFPTNHRHHPALPQYSTPMPAFYQVVQEDPCSYCGRAGGTADHITPKSKGGTYVWRNVTGACRSCNNERGNRSVLEYLLARSMTMRGRQLRRGRVVLGPFLHRTPTGWTCLPGACRGSSPRAHQPDPPAPRKTPKTSWRAFRETAAKLAREQAAGRASAGVLDSRQRG